MGTQPFKHNQKSILNSTKGLIMGDITSSVVAHTCEPSTKELIMGDITANVVEHICEPSI